VYLRVVAAFFVSFVGMLAILRCFINGGIIRASADRFTVRQKIVTL